MQEQSPQHWKTQIITPQVSPKRDHIVIDSTDHPVNILFTTQPQADHMAIHSIALEQAVDVPKTVLFQLLADHDNLGRFFDAEYSLIKQGKPEVNGIGAVREVNTGPFCFQEQIIDYKENEHLHYKIIQGAPVNEHGGWIRFESLSASKSLIHYRIKFSPRVLGTGWLIKLLLENNTKRALANIAKYGESAWQHNKMI